MVNSIMLIGPSGSGKSTLALELYNQSRTKPIIILDADEIRPLWKELGFSREDVNNNVGRLGKLGGIICRQMTDGLVIVLCIAPFVEGRMVAFNHLKSNSNNSALVYLDTELSVRINRDPKGLYWAAQAGKITNLAGYNSQYDAPDEADIILQQGNKTAAELATELLRAIPGE